MRRGEAGCDVMGDGGVDGGVEWKGAEVAEVSVFEVLRVWVWRR